MRSYSIVATNFIAGATERLAGLSDGCPVLLIREPNNEHDRNAVAVWALGNKVGFLPKKQNVALAAFIDQAGTPLEKQEVGFNPTAIMAMDEAPPPTSKTIPAKFFRSPNSKYPMVEVAD